MTEDVAALGMFVSDIAAPQAPSTPSAPEAVNLSGGDIQLTWQAPDDNGAPISRSDTYGNADTAFRSSPDSNAERSGTLLVDDDGVESRNAHKQ